jgi:hypothetical protein
MSDSKAANRMKAQSLVLLIPVVALSCAQSAPTTSSSPSKTLLYNLVDARIFALGPVGYAAKDPEELLRFRAIMALKPDQAKQELEKLNSSGNPQAMSYALVGMRRLDPKRYAELLASARASNVMVRTMWGCIISDEKLRAIADELDSGKYDPLLRVGDKVAP